MIFDSARKAIASLTKKVTKKATSKKKSKDVGHLRGVEKMIPLRKKRSPTILMTVTLIRPMKRPVLHSWWTKMR
jgi:hypothetical protein